MEQVVPSHKNFFYPSGGILMWLIIIIEMGTFGLALVGLMLEAGKDPELYHQSRLQLNTMYGAINTIFLLSSGYCMAMAVQHFKAAAYKLSVRFILLAMLGGALFIILKAIEYAQKLEAGWDLSSNMFFTFYWLLTGFHLVHVLVGLVMLAWLAYTIKKKKEGAKQEDVEAAAAFWHMCDIIWLILFPTLYLIL